MVQSLESIEDMLDVLEQNKENLTVIDFWAEWCGPCKRFKPEFEKLSEKYPTVTFVTINVDDVPDVKDEFEISSLPTFDLVKNGQRVHRIMGTDKPGLDQAIRQWF